MEITLANPSNRRSDSAVQREIALESARRERLYEEEKVQVVKRSIWGRVVRSPVIAIALCACLLLWVTIKAWPSLDRKVKELTVITAFALFLTALYTTFIYCKIMTNSRTIKKAQDRANKLGTLIDRISLLSKMEACLVELDKTNLDVPAAKKLYDDMNNELKKSPQSNKSITASQILHVEEIAPWTRLERKITSMNTDKKGFTTAHAESLESVQTALDALDLQLNNFLLEESFIEKGGAIPCLPCCSTASNDREPTVLSENSPILGTRKTNQEVTEEI